MNKRKVFVRIGPIALFLANLTTDIWSSGDNMYCLGRAEGAIHLQKVDSAFGAPLADRVAHSGRY